MMRPAPRRALTGLLSSIWILTGAPLLAAADADAPSPDPATGGAFGIRAVGKTSVEVSEAGRPVLVYHHGTILREGVDPRYARSGYVHPLHGLDGETLTDDFPEDHFHHRGVFWGWVEVRHAGKAYTHWVPDPAGIVHRFEEWTERVVSRRGARLAMRGGWYAAGRLRIVEERLAITVHPRTSRTRAVDFDLELEAAEDPVELRGEPKKSYGGFSVRYAPQRGKTVIVTSDGRRGEDLVNTPLRWADYTTRFAGASGRSGAAVLVHPSHPSFPPTWLTRHYGALCVGWPGVRPVTLESGRPVRLRYRVLVHRGDLTDEELEAAWREYATGGADRSADPPLPPPAET